jgi:flagellar assembly protein FliH
MVSSDPVVPVSPERTPDRSRVERPSDRVIAADRLVGVQPWTLGAFDKSGRSVPAPVHRVTAEHLPTVDEVSAIEQQARDEGYRAGLAEARHQAEQVAGVLAGIADAIAAMERSIADSLVKLAVDLARQVVRETINVRPEILVPLINDALAGIARTADPGAIHVNPADLPMVEERLGEELMHAGWRAFADDTVERGGCRVVFTGGDVDGTVATRWARVMAQLERDDAWLA